MLTVAIVTWLAGAAQSALNGPTLESAAVWAVFGVLLAALVGVAHEIERGAIATVATAERTSRRRVVSASPDIPARTLRGLSPDMRTPLGCAIYRPESDYATSIRHFLSTVGDAKVIAILGSTPQNGATATAASVAAIASQQVKNVLLVDCDLRQRGTTRLFEADPKAGVLEAAANPGIWSSLIEHEPETGLHIMPAARLTNPWGRLFGMPGLADLMEQWRQRYDLIVLDCPPALTNADGAMLTRLADVSVLVIAWDETPSSHLRQMMRRLRHNAKLINLHLNRSPSDLLDKIRLA